MKRHRMFINGEWVESKNGKVFPVINPSRQEVTAEGPDAGAEDVERAVAAARAAFDSGVWPGTTAQERGRVLFRLADWIRKHSGPPAGIETRNRGKSLVEAEFDMADGGTCLE